MKKISFVKAFYWFRQKWTNFWANKEITKKTIFTATLLILYILATTITAPFVIIKTADVVDNDTFLNTLNLVGGGGLRNFSLMALGISPFINASLIMSLLQTRAFPAVHKLTQSGPHGRRKLNIITRFLTLLIAYPQAILLTTSLSAGQNPFIEFVPLANNSALTGLTSYFLLPLILMGGSLFSLYLAEQITNKGIGNGTSLLIFVGIAFQLPAQFRGAFSYFVGDGGRTSTFVGALKFLTYIFVYLLVIFVIALVYNAERHIPIQQIGAGRSKNVNEMGKLPIKLNPGGIMPIIFSTMLLSLPLMIARILPETNLAKVWMEKNLSFTSALGLSLLVVITFFFSYLMGLQQSRIDRIAEDFAKNSTFIPGIKPGEETENYLFGVVLRLCTFSAFYLIILASMQYLQIILLDFPTIISFGGTGMMILVTVSIETILQYKARIKSSRLSKQKVLSNKAADKLSKPDPFAKKGSESKDGDGLLW
ncbi:preprotein translocase subunit SecY [Mycoplasmopsis columbinasalis]|uniref:Protein translocase subunit SecY n=1 Tax=Mycoplasmopsis columbinasalis TaxID=114880 RepID=A0A449BAR6_9BACT|nr:preprotein translocase subunit SecY [Mycoplasmopsis columbinasalis]VEU78295.1 preprotein translocase subunit SecY [Mycoplasmopsis columbinasalis]